MKYHIFLLILLVFMSYPLLSVSQSISISDIDGMNLTGLERTWLSPKLKTRKLKRQINEISTNGISVVRIPLAFDYFCSSDPRFFKKIEKVLTFSSSKDIEIILAYFGHELTEANLEKQTKIISANWVAMLKSLPKKHAKIYLEIVNEPTVSPSSWERAAAEIIAAIRDLNQDVPIIVGATNANSMFELTRMQPFPFDNLIYTFHYYEPYIFTHQGTSWTGDQHATLGVPYPYREENMPTIHPKALGTAGEINFKDYDRTGNTIAVEDKISQIASWAEMHQVELWCTEFGVTINADTKSRVNYINDVMMMLKRYQIPGIVWEWEGNFGVDQLLIAK